MEGLTSPAKEVSTGSGSTIDPAAGRDCMKSPDRWRTGASPGGKMTQRSPLSTSRATEDPLSRDPLTTFHTVSELDFSHLAAQQTALL
jgi:hypothetical protein